MYCARQKYEMVVQLDNPVLIMRAMPVAEDETNETHFGYPAGRGTW